MEQCRHRKRRLWQHLETICEQFHNAFDSADRRNPYTLSWQCHSAPMQTSSADVENSAHIRAKVCTLFCAHTPPFNVIRKCLDSNHSDIDLTDHEVHALRYLYACLRHLLMSDSFRHMIGTVCVDLIREAPDKEGCRVSRSDNARTVLLRNNRKSERLANETGTWYNVQFELRPFDGHCRK